MVTALLLSGGTGMRMGVETPKQYIEVNGKPIIAYGLQTLLSHEGIDAVQIVADAMWRETILNCMEHLRSGGHDSISPEKKDRGIEKFRFGVNYSRNGICFRKIIQFDKRRIAGQH